MCNSMQTWEDADALRRIAQERSGNSQGTFWEYSGNIRGTFRTIIAGSIGASRSLATTSHSPLTRLSEAPNLAIYIAMNLST